MSEPTEPKTDLPKLIHRIGRQVFALQRQCGVAQEHFDAARDSLRRAKTAVEFAIYGETEQPSPQNTRAPCPIKDEGEETGGVSGAEVDQFMREFDAGLHPLSTEDEAALRQMKPELFRKITAILGKPEASPATTGKGPMELSLVLNRLIDLWQQRQTRILENAKEGHYRDGLIDAHSDCISDVQQLLRELSAPSEGRATDEQGGLTVTPNSSSPASTQGEATTVNRLLAAIHDAFVFLNEGKTDQAIQALLIPPVISPPALPLPLSEETKKDL